MYPYASMYMCVYLERCAQAFRRLSYQQIVETSNLSRTAVYMSARTRSSHDNAAFYRRAKCK